MVKKVEKDLTSLECPNCSNHTSYVDGPFVRCVACDYRLETSPGYVDIFRYPVKISRVVGTIAITSIAAVSLFLLSSR